MLIWVVPQSWYVQQIRAIALGVLDQLCSSPGCVKSSQASHAKLTIGGCYCYCYCQCYCALGLEKKTELYTKSELTQYLTPYPTLYQDSFVLQMYDLCDAPSIWQAANDS